MTSEPTTVLVVGTGLIGASVGLALGLTGEHDVLLHDLDENALSIAIARGAGRRWDGLERAQVVLVAVPPAVTAPTLGHFQRLGLGQTYSHVSSVQSQVQREVQLLGCDLTSFVGSHPIAGREVSGPGNATADLFAGRPWAVCATPMTDPSSVNAIRSLAEACGALPVSMDAESHDAAVGLVSHLPQVTASALAGLLPVEGELGLSGPGLADTTRLAASDPDLWTQILSLNAVQVAPPVRALARRLEGLADALDALGAGSDQAAAAAARASIYAFLEQGNAGRANVPVKRGVRDQAFASVSVRVPDEPGQLAALLNAAAKAGVNVEDVRVDHVPGRPHGVIELLVAATTAAELTDFLASDGWLVVATS